MSCFHRFPLHGIAVSLGCFVLTTLIACAGGGNGQLGGQGSAQPSPAPQSQELKPEDLVFYYDFDDVAVPKEMSLNTQDSFVFETPQFRTGILKFSGGVDSYSLVDFFIQNMAKDNWTKHSSLKAKTSILVFEKPGKNCYISITDESFSTTTAEIMVVEQRRKNDFIK